MDVKDMKYIKPDFLEKARRGGYICPVCGNGSGTDGTGIKPHGDPPSYRCFRCDWHGDVIDLFGERFDIPPERRIPEFKKQYGLTDNTPNKESASKQKDRPTGERKMDENRKTRETKDYLDYYRKCRAVNDGAYLAARGISKKTQDHFLVGYDSAWSANENVTPTPRVIIPRSRTNYLARDVREGVKNFGKMTVGSTALFNEKVLTDKKPNRAVFVVEGEIDAMSVYEAGGDAIAICGTGNAASTGLFFSRLKEDKPDRPHFFLMLDNDNAGIKARDDLATGLENLGFPCRAITYDADDPNDLLKKDREAFSKIVADAKNAVRKEALPFPTVHEDAAFLADIEKHAATLSVKTGFEAFDKEDEGFFGGLHEGLYVLGAVSNEGKSTFALQLANQIAEQGTPVMFFSTEQDKRELISKDISRGTFRIAGTDTVRRPDGREVPIARNYFQIADGRRYVSYTDAERNVIQSARADYDRYNRNLIYIDRKMVITMSDGKEKQMSLATIETDVKKYIGDTGERPVVFVDYLQNLKAADPHMTDKQNTDNTVYGLEALATICGIAVVAISSFNRENYSEPVSMSSFKESGAIEYSADVLLALQQDGMDYTEEDRRAAADRKKRIFDLRKENDERRKNHEPIKMELKCLKQRNGMPFTVKFNFYGAYNYFSDGTDGDEKFMELDENAKLPFEDDGQAEFSFV